jgi:vesicle-fusing ATPase
MGVMHVFNFQIPVPNVATLTDLDETLKSVKAFNDQERQKVINELEGTTGTTEVKVGIKEILSILEKSQQDEDLVSCFVDAMADRIGENRGE